MRARATQASNVYFLVFFAACRELFKGDQSQEVVKQIEGKARGQVGIEKMQTRNFTFCFGCPPCTGVKADTKFCENFI